MQIEELKYTCIINIFVLFINPSRLKKTAEHQKTVLQRKKALEEKKVAVPFSEIEGDITQMGNLLAIYDCSSSWKSLARLLLKKHTIKSKSSCFAWDMTFSLIIEKRRKKMVQDLLPVIKAIDKMPQAYFTNVLQSEVNLDEGTQRITLRISRAD